eukprot:403355773
MNHIKPKGDNQLSNKHIHHKNTFEDQFDYQTSSSDDERSSESSQPLKPQNSTKNQPKSIARQQNFRDYVQHSQLNKSVDLETQDIQQVEENLINSSFNLNQSVHHNNFMQKIKDSLQPQQYLEAEGSQSRPLRIDSTINNIDNGMNDDTFFMIDRHNSNHKIFKKRPSSGSRFQRSESVQSYQLKMQAISIAQLNNSISDMNCSRILPHYYRDQSSSNNLRNRKESIQLLSFFPSPSKLSRRFDSDLIQEHSPSPKNKSQSQQIAIKINDLSSQITSVNASPLQLFNGNSMVSDQFPKSPEKMPQTQKSHRFLPQASINNLTGLNEISSRNDESSVSSQNDEDFVGATLDNKHILESDRQNKICQKTLNPENYNQLFKSIMELSHQRDSAKNVSQDNNSNEQQKQKEIVSAFDVKRFKTQGFKQYIAASRNQNLQYASDSYNQPNSPHPIMSNINQNQNLRLFQNPPYNSDNPQQNNSPQSQFKEKAILHKHSQLSDDEESKVTVQGRFFVKTQSSRDQSNDTSIQKIDKYQIYDVTPQQRVRDLLKQTVNIARQNDVESFQKEIEKFKNQIEKSVESDYDSSSNQEIESKSSEDRVDIQYSNSTVQDLNKKKKSQPNDSKNIKQAKFIKSSKNKQSFNIENNSQSKADQIFNQDTHLNLRDNHQDKSPTFGQKLQNSKQKQVENLHTKNQTPNNLEIQQNLQYQQYQFEYLNRLRMLKDLDQQAYQEALDQIPSISENILRENSHPITNSFGLQNMQIQQQPHSQSSQMQQQQQVQMNLNHSLFNDEFPSMQTNNFSTMINDSKHQDSMNQNKTKNKILYPPSSPDFYHSQGMASPNHQGEQLQFPQNQLQFDAFAQQNQILNSQSLIQQQHQQMPQMNLFPPQPQINTSIRSPPFSDINSHSSISHQNQPNNFYPMCSNYPTIYYNPFLLQPQQQYAFNKVMTPYGHFQDQNYQQIQQQIQAKQLGEMMVQQMNLNQQQFQQMLDSHQSYMTQMLGNLSQQQLNQSSKSNSKSIQKHKHKARKEVQAQSLNNSSQRYQDAKYQLQLDRIERKVDKLMTQLQAQQQNNNQSLQHSQRESRHNLDKFEKKSTAQSSTHKLQEPKNSSQNNNKELKQSTDKLTINNLNLLKKSMSQIQRQQKQQNQLQLQQQHHNPSQKVQNDGNKYSTDESYEGETD